MDGEMEMGGWGAGGLGRHLAGKTDGETPLNQS